jgi:GNAT superfamily N-acetyltransferase
MPSGSLEIHEVETGKKHGFRFSAFFGTRHVGHIEAHRTTRGGRVIYTVDNVFVEPDARRRGVGTALYQAAAAEACRRRATLGSTERNPGAFSHDFWEKQRAAGRAELLRARGEQPIYALRRELCPAPVLANPRRGADPEPEEARAIPHRLVLLERFGAAYYVLLFRAAQGEEEAHARQNVLNAARAYLRAGGRETGLRHSALHVQDQARPLLEDWYGAEALIGPRSHFLHTLLDEIATRG